MPRTCINRRQQLLARIGRHFSVVSNSVEIGRLRFQFTRIANPDKVLDDMAAAADLHDRLHGTRAEGSQLHLPYWAELWESAMGIGMFLEAGGLPAPLPAMVSDYTSTAPGNGAGPAILDLGCGMGMSGTVAAALGARVTFADLEPPALLFAQLNSMPWRRRVRARRLDWQRDRLRQKFHMILGADILYERAQWPFLDAFWRAHLLPGASVLLGEPGRQTGDMFVDWITSHGWRLKLTDVPVPQRPRPIRVFRIELIQ